MGAAAPQAPSRAAAHDGNGGIGEQGRGFARKDTGGRAPPACLPGGALSPSAAPRVLSPTRVISPLRGAGMLASPHGSFKLSGGGAGHGPSASSPTTPKLHPPGAPTPPGSGHSSPRVLRTSRPEPAARRALASSLLRDSAAREGAGQRPPAQDAASALARALRGADGAGRAEPRAPRAGTEAEARPDSARDGVYLL